MLSPLSPLRFERGQKRNTSTPAPLLPQHLTDPEQVPDDLAARMVPAHAKKVAAYLHKIHTPEESAVASKAGRVTRGQYDETHADTHALLGHEAPRFMAFHAATSPRTPYEQNIHAGAKAFLRYTRWMRKRAGEGNHEQPTYEEARAKVAHWRSKGMLGGIASHDNNIALAIASNDPSDLTKQLLSGPKVSEYHAATMGAPGAYPGDVHAANLAGLEQEELSGDNLPHPHGAKTPAGNNVNFKGPNAAVDALKLRAIEGKQKLNQDNPGKPWTLKEKQETEWAFVKALTEEGTAAYGEPGFDPKKVLASLTHERVASGTSFADILFRRDENGKPGQTYRLLQKLGYGESLKRVFAQYQAREKAKAKSRNRPTGPVVSGFSSEEREAAERIAERLVPRMARGRYKELSKERGKKAKMQRIRYAALQAPTIPLGPMPQAMPQAMPPAQMPQQPAAPQLPPIDEHRESLLAYSPNVDDLSFEDALARSRAGNHKAFKKIVEHINEQVGLKAHLSDAVGDWSDGAENSILQRIDEPIDSKTADYLASWYGLLANQKAVLAFSPQHSGLDSVYQIELPETDLGAIRKSLTKAGIAFRTLIPGKKGTKVVIYDEKRQLRDQVAQWAGLHNASIHESIGAGRYIGGSTRTAARAAYRKNITAYEAAAAKSGGSIRAYRPPVQPRHLRPAQESGPVRQARKGQVIRFASGPLPSLARNPRIPSAPPQEQHTGFVRPPESASNPKDIHSGITFGGDWVSRDTIRRLYRQLRGRSDPQAKTARHLLRQVWRGDTTAIDPAFDAVQEAGGSNEVNQVLSEGMTPQVMRERLTRLGNGPRNRAAAGRNDTFAADWQNRTDSLGELAQDQSTAEGTPSVGERLRSLGRKAKGAARKIGDAALRQVPKQVLPAGPRKRLYGWEGYHKQHGLPRDQAPDYDTQQEPPIKLHSETIKMSAVQAPAGGVVVRGLFYPGGKWIPSANLEKASYDQYQHVERQKMKKQYRREDGSVSVEPALQSDGAEEALKMSKSNYTPGVDNRVEKIRSALGRGGKPAKPAPAARPLKPIGGHIGSGLRR